jgi:adenylate cyclase
VRRRSQERRKLFLTIVLVVGTSLGVLAYGTEAFESLELSSVDARFAVRGTQAPPRDLVVVQIDDVTFDTLGLQWPFPRAVHAKVIDRIAADRPKVISYDVQFTERSAIKLRAYAAQGARVLGLSRSDARRALGQIGDDDDVALGVAILDSHRKTALSFTETDNGRVNFVGGGANALDVVHGRAGNGLFVTDSGGVIRRLSYEIDHLQTLPVASYELATGKRVDPADFPPKGAWIDYRGSGGTITSVPFSAVVRNTLPKGYFKDKWVVVGPSALTLQDVHPTSTTGRDDNMSGAEIQASALDTIRRGFPLRSVPTWVDYLLVVLAGVLTPLLSMRLRALWPFAIALAAGALYALASILLFDAGHVVALAYPLITLGASAIGALAVHYMSAAFERERTRDIFSRFVPENVVDEVLQQTGGARLGGVARTATVMFSDLRGFTSFAESLEPEQVIEVLNRYLTAMVDDAIDPHGGTLVDYMGDGIMAVFGAPIELADHADRALAAARAKLRRLDEFNAWMHDEYGFDKSFRMGIGLNSGHVMSGNVGSETRLAYTAIGDTTNTAARLEGMTKGTDLMLFMSESTKEGLSSKPDDLAFVGEYEIRGRMEKLSIWSVEQSRKAKDGGDSFASIARTETLADK